MNASGIFLSCMMVMLIFNLLYLSTLPEAVNTMIIGAVTGLIVTVMGLSAIFGLTVLGTGLNPASVKTLFGVSTIINILFQINIAGFPIGLGLANNMINVFPTGELLGIGFWIATIISIVTLVSGVITVTSGGA